MRSDATVDYHTVLSGTYAATSSGASAAPPLINSFSVSLNSACKRLSVVLEVSDGLTAEEIAAAEYSLALKLLQLSQLAAARLLGITLRSSQRYAGGKHAVPEKVMTELWSWVATIARLPEDDQPLGYAALRIITLESKYEGRYFVAQDPLKAIDTFFSETLPRLRAKSVKH